MSTTSSRRKTTSTAAIRRSRASLEADGACIVGGGIAGLATAAALKRIAHVEHVTVLEKSSPHDFCDERQGAALQLSPNGLKALRYLGGDECLQQVLEQGTQLKGNVLLHTNEKKNVADDSSSKTVIHDRTKQTTGLPQVLIRWGVLRRILTELINEKDIRTNVEVSDYRVSEDGRIQVLNRDGDVISISSSSDDDETTALLPPLLVAADGIHSELSKRLRPTNNIKDNGRVNIKAVAPRPLKDDGMTYSFFEGNIACFAGPAGGDATTDDAYTYWAISIASSPNDDEDDFTKASLDTVKAKLIQTLEEIDAPSFIRELIQATDARRIFVRQSEESVHVGPTLFGESVVLVGDGAHAMSPSYGQCGSMALEDAVTLACCISKAENDLPQALAQYSHARTSRCEEMVRRSAERTAKAVKGEPTEDVSQWIFQWEPPC